MCMSSCKSSLCVSGEDFSLIAGIFESLSLLEVRSRTLAMSPIPLGAEFEDSVIFSEDACAVDSDCSTESPLKEVTSRSIFGSFDKSPDFAGDFASWLTIVPATRLSVSFSIIFFTLDICDHSSEVLSSSFSNAALDEVCSAFK